MGRIRDIIGQRFYKFVVVREFHVPYEGYEQHRKTIRKCECLCDCGNTFFPYKSNVLAGHTRGCINCQNAHNIVGKRIGKILILERFWMPKGDQRGVWYKIKCDCGNEFTAPSHLAMRLKGIRCAKCPTKPKPTLTVKQSLTIINYKKHLRSKGTLIGRKNGYLTVLKFCGWKQLPSRRIPMYLMKCKCGNKIIRRGDAISTTKSCGCMGNNMMRGEDNPRAILKNKEVYEIKELLKTNIYKNKEIAKIYNVSESMISHIKKGKVYNI